MKKFAKINPRENETSFEARQRREVFKSILTPDKRKYILRRERGLCIWCGHRKARQFGSYCVVCVIVRRKYNDKFRKKRISKGQCPRCGKPTKKTVDCNGCLEKRRIKDKLREMGD